MAIKSIEIKNFKSIEYLKINLTDLNAFVGKNGAGKSTILKAVEYFYDNLIDLKANNSNFDTNNFHKRKLEIAIEYDLSRITTYANGSYGYKLFGMMYSDGHYLDELYTVRMVQEKNSSIEWNVGYKERYIIYNSNPVYFCNTRAISLTNWDALWDVVGDLVNAKDANEISAEFNVSLQEKSFLSFKNYVNLFEKFLSNNNLSINSYTKKEKIISLLQLQLGGKEFINENENLDYFSDGTNSKNFILFLSYIAYEISVKRLKDATIFLDEPELGLHPKMIDQLMEKIVEYSARVKFLIFSHSPRLVAYVLRNSGELYSVYNHNKYTRIKKIIKSLDERHHLIMTEREASYLFADFLLFVEGVSEIELFNNKVIQSLFPILKKIDIVNTTSNDHILKMILPKNNKVEIPYLVVIDFDKLVMFKPCNTKPNCKFSIKQLWYSPLSDNKLEKQLKYNYSQFKSRKYLNLKKEILKDTKKMFSYDDQLKSVDGFENTFRKIKDYCLFNNVFTVRTTLEGAIINNKSNKYISKWHIYRNEKVRNLLREHNLNGKVILNRLIFLGKTDTLMNYEEAKFESKYNSIKLEMRKKNTHWITDFFDYYEKTILCQKQYQRDFDNSKKIKRFSADFPELYDIIISIESRLSDE
nr:retron Eco8 family effector endonuclease [Enterococcus sp. DIV0849a]